MKFNEDSRVKIPAILQLTRLGYTYLSLKGLDWDESSNIVPSIFRTSVTALNPSATPVEIENALGQLDLLLDNEDLGKQFYEQITQTSGLKIIDFEDFNRNSFHVVTEFACKKDDEEFRPDITLLINGLPLVFIEVKKPNNRDGILAERNRIITRFRNPKFKRFINITQLMVFSNNMEYDDGSPEPLEGAFYASTSYDQPVFNYFREEEVLNLAEMLQPPDLQTEDFVLTDNNLTNIKHAPEFATNKNPDTPTNRLSTSLFSRARLAFYCVDFLPAYFQKKGKIPKFYFIVDRIDLLDQASREFRSRGLHVHHISSREEFAEDIKSNLAVHNDSGKPEVTVVNIQKFKDDPDVVKSTDYALGLQRVYFLDEVHRSYNPQGSFLANLNQSDRDAIKIGLTGTPLLNASLAGTRDENGEATPRQAYNSKLIFGDYIHKYYYNRSIADGYTLRLIREAIETQYKLQLQETLAQIKVLKDMKNRTLVYAHPKFVEPMLDYPADGGDTLRVIKIKDMRTGLTSDSDIVTANVPSKVKIKNGDILFSWSASLEVMIWAGGEGALNQHIFKVTSDTHPRSFCYFVLLDYLQHFRMMADLRKTTMGHITIDHLEQSQIAIPDDAVAEAFEVVTKPIIDRMVKSHEENQELTQLRDWLLPMLMNGQVTVGSSQCVDTMHKGG